MSLLKTAVVAAVAMIAASEASWADAAKPLGALAKMPIKEITVFKDGHAYVVHQGKMPTDEAGNVVLDYLPSPVLGTFWPHSMNKNARLSSVTAGQQKVVVERTALSLRELIESNPGAEVLVTELPIGPPTQPALPYAATIQPMTQPTPPYAATILPMTQPTPPYAATILPMPVLSGEEQEAVGPPNAGEKLPVKGDVAMFRTAQGVKVVALARIQDITFKGNYKPKASTEEFRNLLTLKLDWANGKADKEAEVGLMYVQRGIRWIPNYKITLDGNGNAKVQLQGTLLNELADLEDADCNLVIGVPTFAFKDTADPMSLQATAARLSQYFQEDGQAGRHMLSNALMSQVRMGGMSGMGGPGGAEQPAAVNLGPEVGGSDRAEDLFVFNVKHVSLKKGRRMVLSIVEFTVPYKDAFVLDLPYVPPQEVFRQFNTQQQAEIARLLAAPKVMHNIRLSNKSQYPLTTAPALIIRDQRVLAQGMMTYTSIGGQVDLAVTAAVDVRVKKADKETKRLPNAAVFDNNQFMRTELAGTISLTNYRNSKVELEIVRNVLGNIDEVAHGGKIEMLNVLEDPTYGHPDGRPYWWNWSSWPYWWSRFNGVGRVTWNLTLEKGESADLSYSWHYYWR